MLASALRPALRCSVSSSSRLAALPARRCFSSSLRLRNDSLRFTAEHEWVKFDASSKVGIVGITKYAAKNLGDVVYVELPSEGSSVSQGDQIGAVESVKAASDIYSPVTGTISQVNDKLGDEPGLLNKSPESDGWLCKIELSDAAEFETLLDAAAYKTLCDEE